MRLSALLGCFCALAATAQQPVVVLTEAADLGASVEQLTELRSAGMRVAVIAAPGCFIGSATDPASLNTLAQRSDITLIATHQRASRINALPHVQRIAAHYLNALLDGVFETPDVLAPMDWAAHDDVAGHVHTDDGSVGQDPSLRGPSFDPALTWTCNNGYHSERMEGVIAASFFFVESNGSIDANQYSWTQPMIDDVKLQAIDAWSIWAYSASLHGATVTAVMDWYEPAGGISVQGYEPITRSSWEDQLWISAIMTNLGRTEPGVTGKLHAFHGERRVALAADHAFSAFIACNPPSQGAPSQMADGKIGYAYLGGPYTQILYRANGWSTSQVNRVYGHEVGHIFHAFDEYASSPSSNCSQLFNGAQNLNYHGSSCNGPASCVMVDNSFTGSGATRQWNLCAHTPYHVGWTGVAPAPIATAPINDSVVTSMPVVLRWTDSGAPPNAQTNVQVFDRNSGVRVLCESMATVDTLAITLVNGLYAWTVGNGVAFSSNGYAGQLSALVPFEVNAPLHADFSGEGQTICAGASVQFTDQSTGAPNAWTWSFPGGNPSTHVGQDPPAVIYVAPGSQAVTLVVQDGLTSDTLTIAAAVIVEAGAPLDFVQDFESGVFPPVGWECPSGGIGGPGGQGGIGWQSDATMGCGTNTAAYVPCYGFSGQYGRADMRSVHLDLVQATAPYLRFRHAYARRNTSSNERLEISARDCDFNVYEELFSQQGADLVTNGGAFVSGQAYAPTTCGEWRWTTIPLDEMIGYTTELEFEVYTGANGQHVYIDDIQVFNGAPLMLRAFLQGPYETGAGMMRDDLRTTGLLPLTEPYSALGWTFERHTGGQTVDPAILAVPGANALVDWVVVEVRSTIDPTQILCSRPALIQRDGDVVDVDGTSPVRLAIAAGSYFIALRHRNHLGVMTATPSTLGATPTLLDLTPASTASWGTNGLRIANNTAQLWAGDATGNGQVKYAGAGNDRDPILTLIGGFIPTNTVSGYLRHDLNLNGQVKYAGSANDRDLILLNVGGSVPTAVRSQQVP
ncbi:MAG: PKD domain-containing protein [Flavobacteriales bacterium]|nr:PKD domain-containing protein [Flavobacteriales bacterium]